MAIDATSLLRAGKYQQLNEHYASLQQQFDKGELSGDHLRDEFRDFYPTDGDLAERYNAWVKAYPKSYVALLARGIYYKRMGAQARGEKYISETDPAQLGRMDNAMALAARDFGASIALDPKPFLSYLHTMDIGRQYISNEQLRKVFDSGAYLDPRSLAIRLKYMSALEPRWGGTTAAMRAFFNECKEAQLPVGDLGELEAMLHVELGVEYREAGNVTLAEAEYRKALSLGACECTNVRNDLNNLLFETNQFNEAITLLDQYLINDPTHLWALANRGAAKMAVNRDAEALADFQIPAQAGDSFSQNKLGLLYLAGAPGVERNVEQSVYWLRKAAEQGEAEAQHLLPEAQRLVMQGLQH